jgi:CheY-like chemotaxis protein
MSLLTLIDDILDFSKIESGQFELDLAEFELEPSVVEVMRILAIGAQQQGLELAYQIEADVPDTLIGDVGRIRQVLLNLVGNAIKFTSRGEVVVRVKNELRTGDAVRLHVTVQDTGIGIPAEKQAAIFDAFTQADSSTTRKYGGTGLGLTISAQLVSMMGGRLWVDSRLGIGSTFHFTIDLGVSQGAVSRKPPIPAMLEGKLVLVVDDNATNCQILQQTLLAWKMRPTLATSGLAALALLKLAATVGAPFPLVLLDSQMPDIDGFTVVERIKSNRKLANTALVMCLSNYLPGDLSRCRALDVAAHLLKPVAPSELLEAIVRALHLVKDRAATAEPTTGSTAHEQRRPLRILLVEDNPVNQAVALHLLTRAGHTVVIAEDGLEALAAFDRETFDLVFMDLQMPKMGGFEATARIRDREKTTKTHLPIIALTAHAMIGDRDRCLASGMDGFVSKPVLLADLFRAIDETMAASEQAQVSLPIDN